VATLAAAAVTASLVAAPSASAAQPQHGTIVSAKRVQHLSPRQIRTTLKTDEFSAAKVRYGVDAYRLVYRTVDPAGHATTASGLVVLPRNARHRLRVINYTHGTMAGRSEAPSADGNGRSDEGMMLASAGYATVEPDYLGLGDGPGQHPYLQVRTEVSASIDLLRAAFTFSARAHRSFDPRLLVTGFSQGGQVAMALGKALQSGKYPRFRLAADAPISGPYDLQNAELPAIFTGAIDPKDAAYYVTYFLTAWNRLYHLYGKASDVFRAPYDKTVAPLYNGKHDDGEIFSKLPASPQQLLTPAGLELIKHPSPTLVEALRANDQSCTAWSKAAPIHIYAAHGDEQVAIANAYHCQQQLSNNHIGSSLVDVGNYGHLDSGRHGLADALRWFLSAAPPRV
jgi:hypothetical protein